MGNNFAVKGTFFRRVKGFSSLTNSVVEDVDFLKIVCKEGGLPFLDNTEVSVHTKSESSWEGLINQRVRWAKGVRFNVKQKFVVALYLLFLCCVLFTAFGNIQAFCVLYLLRTLWLSRKSFLIGGLCWSVLVFDLYKINLYLFVFLKKIGKSIFWKGRRYPC